MATLILVALVLVGLVGLYDELVVSRRSREEEMRRMVQVRNEPTVTLRLAAWYDDRDRTVR